MSYVQDSYYSLKDFNEINNNYNNYLRVVYANNINDPTILNSIYPPLKDSIVDEPVNNKQILFMPFLEGFIKGAPGFEIVETLPSDTPNFTDYLITTYPDDDDEKEDEFANKQKTAQQLIINNKGKKDNKGKLSDEGKKGNDFVDKLTNLENDTDYTDETDETGQKQSAAAAAREAKTAIKTAIAQAVTTGKRRVKGILTTIQSSLPNNIKDKLTAKQAAAAQQKAATAQQKAATAQQKEVAEAEEAAAKKAITVFNSGLVSFKPESLGKLIIPPNLYLNPSAVAFYDSLHDFGYEICDTETDKKKVANYGYSKFMFSYLLSGGYTELNLVPDFNLLDFQANYSYLKGYTRPISPEGLENYFVIGNMYNIVKDEPSLAERIQNIEQRSLPEPQETTNGDLQIVINTKLNYLRTTDGKYFVVENPSAKNLVKMKITSTITDNKDNEKNNRAQKQLDIYDHLAEFFAEYSDPAFVDGQESFADGQVPGKIKLCIDFQSNLNKIMRKNNTKNKFCLLYTAETITDSASKSKAEAVDETFGFKNWYIEALNNDNGPGGTRGHYGGTRGHYGGPSTGTDIHSVKGNISVKYNSIQYSDPNDLQKADYIVNLNYFYKNNNDSINASEGENIIMNKKQTAKKAVTDKVNEFVEKTSKIFKFPTITTNNKNSIMSQIIITIKNILGKNSPLLKREEFYALFNQNINNTAKTEELYKVYALYYAIKRLGDSLQAEVCKLDNLKEMLFYRVKINKSNKYAVDFNEPITPKKGAVLVTHDRMLFAYAVINNIPAILDMENHMIIFKPRTNETTASIDWSTDESKEGNISGDTSGNISGDMSGDTSGDTSGDMSGDTSGDMVIGGNHIQTGGDAIDDLVEDLVEDIFSNIDAIMRYLYFRRNLGKPHKKSDNNNLHDFYGTKNIANFVEIVCELLYNENSVNNVYDEYLHIEYITNYKYNVLLIGTRADIDIMTAEIEHEALNIKKSNTTLTPAHDDDLLEVNTFIYIYINDQNYLKITRDYDGGVKVIQLDFMYNGAHTSTLKERIGKTGFIYRNKTNNGHQFNKDNISRSLKDVDIEIYDSYLETLLRIIQDSGANYLEEDDNPVDKQVTVVVKLASPETHSEKLQINLREEPSGRLREDPSGRLREERKKKQKKQIKDARLNQFNERRTKFGGAPNDRSYQEILGADFDKLKDPTNLLQNNITVLTFLHQLLREYELSFINYEEGIDTFYCKINESVQLSYTIGLYNFMPRDYEFYVFLTLLIEQYNATTITTINFALFEYYLYMTKADNDIYYHYLTIKSYLLEDSYQVSMTPEIKAELQQNTETYNFFEKLIAEVTDTSYTITEIIYLDIQTKNTDYKVTNNIKNYYNLKLCGFSDLQEEFTNKTLKIIGELVEAKSPLIAKYIPNVEEIKEAEEIKGAEEIKEEEKEEVAEEEEKEEVAKGVEEEVAKGVEGVKKIPSYEKDTNKKIPINNGTPDGAVDGTTDDAVSNITTDDAVSGVKKDDAAGPSQGGKINKSTRHKYRKEKSKTKRKKTKRQQIKVQVNQTKKNRKNKKKRNTKRKIE